MALILSFAPATKPQHEPRRILERRAARLLTPEKAVPPRSVRTPAAPKPRPRAQAQAKPPVAEKAPAPVTRRQPTPAPRVARRPAQRRDPEVGKRGREAAQQATRTLKKTTAGIDNLLSSVDGVVPVSGTSSEGTSSGAVQKYALAAGRQAEQLESLDGALEAQGAGRGGGSAGVSREGVAIVDDGVRTIGGAADLQGRDTASLMAVVQRYKAGVKFCYDNALKRTEGLQGKITLQMDIDASGRITTLNVASDSLGNRALQKCILSQVKKWRFPKVDGGTVRFTLPLVFSPPESS
jgi:TonB family protein